MLKNLVQAIINMLCTIYYVRSLAGCLGKQKTSIIAQYSLLHYNMITCVMAQ